MARQVEQTLRVGAEKLPNTQRGVRGDGTPVGDDFTDAAPAATTEKVGADEATALQSGRAKYALMRPLRSKAVEQNTLSSPLRILAVADGGTAMGNRIGWSIPEYSPLGEEISGEAQLAHATMPRPPCPILIALRLRRSARRSAADDH